MAGERGRHDWAQTSAVLAMIHNANVGDRAKARPPAYFDPYRRAEWGEPAPVVAPITSLRSFVLK